MAASSVHDNSAAAFVEGGIQEACEDSCSICLEDFSDTNPLTVTSCKHGYHLQCILEWYQRSKDCPMCWNPLSLKDPNSQELLEAVGHERSIRKNQRFPALFPQGYLEEMNFQHVSSFGGGGGDSDLEERMKRLATTAAMGRAHRRGNARNRQHQPQFVLVPARTFSTTQTAPLSTQLFGDEIDRNECGEIASLGSERSRMGPVQDNEQMTEPAMPQLFSGSWKSRIVAASSRCKESFANTAKELRERLNSRNGMPEFSARAREMSAGVVRALERISLEPSPLPKGNAAALVLPDSSGNGEAPPLVDSQAVSSSVNENIDGGSCTSSQRAPV